MNIPPLASNGYDINVEESSIRKGICVPAASISPVAKAGFDTSRRQIIAKAIPLACVRGRGTRDVSSWHIASFHLIALQHFAAIGAKVGKAFPDAFHEFTSQQVWELT